MVPSPCRSSLYTIFFLPLHTISLESERSIEGFQDLQGTKQIRLDHWKSYERNVNRMVQLVPLARDGDFIVETVDYTSSETNWSISEAANVLSAKKVVNCSILFKKQ